MNAKLLKRVKQINLYAHSYAFTLNSKYGNFDIYDLLNFAHKHKLQGISIHIDLVRHKSENELKKIKSHANRLGLKINLEVSSTSRKEVDSAIKIAKVLNSKNIRVYIRYAGHLSEIIKKAVQDLKYISKVAEDNDLRFVLEQHEVLKSRELVGIVKKVNNPRVGLLFDFGNMVNADEMPLKALEVMSPYIRQVHMKGVCIVKKKFGYGQVGVPQGKGDLPQREMLSRLLLLGGDKPQVEVFALEQEVGYKSPPFRFSNKGKDPIIPDRKPSDTASNKNLLLERQNAAEQVKYIRKLLEKLIS